MAMSSIKASPLAVLTIRTYGLGASIYGATVMYQGPQRWTGSQYRAAVELAPSWCWGLLLVICGVVTLIGSLRGWFHRRNVGLLGIAVWVFFLAYSITQGARIDPHASLAGAVFFATVAVAILIVTFAREDRSDDEDDSVVSALASHLSDPPHRTGGGPQ